MNLVRSFSLRPVFLFSVTALVFPYGWAVPGAWAAGDAIRVTQGGRISADVVDLPLDQVLADLSRKAPVEVKGSPRGGERLTLHFSNLSLEEALRRVMAGYNYVLFLPPEGQGGRATLTIVGKVSPRKIDSSLAAAAPASPAAQPPASAPDAGQAPALEAGGQPDAAEASAPPGVLPPPDSQPEFNPAAWGGKGRRR